MTDTFFEKPINGDITHYSENTVEQHDPKEFIEVLDLLVSNPDVLGVRWEQYTPSFNDGDPCVFGTNEFTVRLVNSDNPDSDYEGGYLGTYQLYRYKPGHDYRSGDAARDYRYGYLDGVTVETFEIYNALNKLNNISPHHYIVLNEKFGDPAEVTYDGESFSVEYYDHD